MTSCVCIVFFKAKLLQRLMLGSSINPVCTLYLQIWSNDMLVWDSSKTLVLLTIWTRSFFVVQAYLVHCRLFGSILNRCPLGASSKPPFFVVTTKKCLETFPNVPWGDCMRTALTSCFLSFHLKQSSGLCDFIFSHLTLSCCPQENSVSPYFD